MHNLSRPEIPLDFKSEKDGTLYKFNKTVNLLFLTVLLKIISLLHAK